MTDKKLEELEEQRRLNAIEMEERCRRTRERMMAGIYPMQDNNPLLNATDDEIREHIRKRRGEFEERHRNDPPKPSKNA